MKKVKKFILVDDDQISCIVSAAILEGIGVAEQIVSIYSGLEALQYIGENYTGEEDQRHIDLIFLDLNMPLMDGFEVLDALRELNNVDKSRFVIAILSSSKSSSDIKKASSYKDLVYCYIEKPLSEERVKEIVESISMKF